MKLAFTIATANYLHQAKAAGSSFLQHNPSYQFTIYLFDKVNNRFDVNDFSPLQIVEVESLHIEGFDEMVARYTLFEMSNALKPFVAENILKSNNAIEYLVYIDSDIMFYNGITLVEEELQKNDIVITPHIHTPIPYGQGLIDEKAFLNSGIYNGGFFALKPCEETRKFLIWWKTRLSKECLVDVAKGLFVDQIWLNLLPIYFQKVCILPHLGYNVAYWNLHERTILLKNEIVVNDDKTPLVFYHFSGFDYDFPETISKYQTRNSFDITPELKSIYVRYKDFLKHNSYDTYTKLECVYYTKSRAYAELEKGKEENLKITSIVKRQIKKIWNFSR